MLQPDHAAGIDYWKAPRLAALPRIAHGFTGRAGGTSLAPFDTLNLSLRVGDVRERVMQNRQRALGAIAPHVASGVIVKQVHGADIVQVTANAGPNIAADGLWTRDTRTALLILTADCVPILFADKKARAIGAVHAGWRGTAARIAATMVQRLADAGVPATDLEVAIGPGIGPCCFAIGGDVLETLRAAHPGATPDAFVERDGRMHADLWQLNVMQLIASGVAPEAVSVGRLCTVCTSALYSHRRDAGTTGRQAGIIALQQDS